MREASPSRRGSAAATEGGAASCQSQRGTRGPRPGGCWPGLFEPAGLRAPGICGVGGDDIHAGLTGTQYG